MSNEALALQLLKKCLVSYRVRIGTTDSSVQSYLVKETEEVFIQLLEDLASARREATKAKKALQRKRRIGKDASLERNKKIKQTLRHIESLARKARLGGIEV